MRYFALLYTPPEKRDAVMALFIIDSELRESAQSANHDVAQDAFHLGGGDGADRCPQPRFRLGARRGEIGDPHLASQPASGG